MLDRQLAALFATATASINTSVGAGTDPAVTGIPITSLQLFPKARPFSATAKLTS